MNFLSLSQNPLKDSGGGQQQEDSRQDAGHAPMPAGQLHGAGLLRLTRRPGMKMHQIYPHFWRQIQLKY